MYRTVMPLQLQAGRMLIWSLAKHRMGGGEIMSNTLCWKDHTWLHDIIWQKKRKNFSTWISLRAKKNMKLTFKCHQVLLNAMDSDRKFENFTFDWYRTPNTIRGNICIVLNNMLTNKNIFKAYISTIWFPLVLSHSDPPHLSL